MIVLRHTDPDRPRPFRCPGVPLVPILSIVCCVGLMIPLPVVTWIRFVGWLVIVLVLYFLYGKHSSRLGRAGAAATTQGQRTSSQPAKLPKASTVKRPPTE